MSAPLCTYCDQPWKPSCADHEPVAVRMAPLRPAARHQSECSRCPAYVVRCAHLEGDPRVVWLIDHNVSPLAWHCGHWPFETLLGIPLKTVGPACLPDSMCSCAVMAPDDTSDFQGHANRAEADTAFERFEAILLGRHQPQTPDVRLAQAIERNGGNPYVRDAS